MEGSKLMDVFVFTAVFLDLFEVAHWDNEQGSALLVAFGRQGLADSFDGVVDLIVFDTQQHGDDPAA